jgi:hypothetical protein
MQYEERKEWMKTFYSLTEVDGGRTQNKKRRGIFNPVSFITKRVGRIRQNRKERKLRRQRAKTVDAALGGALYRIEGERQPVAL